MQRSWRGTACYWLAPHGLMDLLSNRTQDRQDRVAPPTMAWVLPSQSRIKKMFYRFLDLMEVFSQLTILPLR